MKPGEHKTVQARILGYAEAIGWTFVPREEVEQRRGGIPLVGESGGWKTPAPLSLFFDGLLDAKVREFNPRYAEAEGALLGQLRHLHADIYGNREFVEYLRNRGKFLDHEEKRERDLILIDYDDPARNIYEVTEEWAFHNGHYGTREDVVFLINGIPVLVIECKNANKDEAIALGVDQIRRYHCETPELFVSQQLFTATDAIGFSYGVSWNRVRRNIVNWKEGGHSCPPHSKILTACKGRRAVGGLSVCTTARLSKPPLGNSPICASQWQQPLLCRHWPFGIQPYIAHNGPQGFRAGNQVLHKTAQFQGAVEPGFQPQIANSRFYLRFHVFRGGGHNWPPAYRAPAAGNPSATASHDPATGVLRPGPRPGGGAPFLATVRPDPR